MCVLKFIYQTSYPYRIYLFGMIFAILLVSIDASAKPYIIKLLIDSTTGSASYDITTLVIIYAFFQIVNVVAWSLSDCCAIRYSGAFRADIASILVQKISQYSHSFFQNQLSGSLTAKINDAFTLTPALIFTIIYEFVNFTLTTLIALILLGKVHAFFAISMIVWITFFLGLTFFCLKKVIPLIQECAESKSGLWGGVADIFTNMFSVRSFANQSYERNRLEKISGDYIKRSNAQGYYIMKFYIIQGVIISVYILGFLLGLIYLHSLKLITAGDFVLVFMLNFYIAGKLYDLSHRLRDFVPNWGTVDQALKILEQPVDIVDKPLAKNLIINKGEIVFSRVHFHYKDIEPLFQNKSLTIAGGQKVGLVGYSGGGKTTFVNLVLRLFDVTSGHIFIDGQDIRDVTQNSLHLNIGLIPQDPSLFHRTLEDNIHYGWLDATHEEVIEASKKAYAHDFIIKLPKGYDSLVGERGVKLSGGQRQRIAIAQAILKNAPILILDEATSQLDSVTEKKIQDSLWKLMQGKTTIVVAHRLSTLLLMDRILVFDRGKIVEDGTHENLLSQGGLYKSLWQAQTSGFLPDTFKEN